MSGEGLSFEQGGGGEELVLVICGREAGFSTSAAAGAPPAVEMTTISEGLRFDGWERRHIDVVFDR
jgi:hypothetical protein